MLIEIFYFVGKDYLMCDKLDKTFSNFLKSGWIIPLVLQIIACILTKILYYIYELYKFFKKIIKR